MHCFNLSIYINDGLINISQEQDADSKPDTIVLSKEQIGLVLEWLTEAKQSLEEWNERWVDKTA